VFAAYGGPYVPKISRHMLDSILLI
jgi:hypothetical protein